MTWAKFDDRYDDHRKIKACARRDPVAATLHAHSITASSRHETDGVVDAIWLEERVPDKRKREKALAALVDLRLFDVLTAGEVVERADRQGWNVQLGPFRADVFLVHDYLDYNPSSAQLSDRRAKDAARKAKGRNTRYVRPDSTRTPNGVTAVVHAESAGPESLVPTRLVP